MNFFYIGLQSSIDVFILCLVVVYCFQGTLWGKDYYENISYDSEDGEPFKTEYYNFFLDGLFFDQLRTMFKYKDINANSDDNVFGIGKNINHWAVSLSWLNACSTGFCMTMIAVERYILVCRATEAADILTKKRRYVLAVVVMLLIPLCWYNSRKNTYDESPIIYKQLKIAFGSNDALLLCGPMVR